MVEGNLKRYTWRCDEKYLKLLKLLAVQEGTTGNEMLCRVLMEYIEKDPKRKKLKEIVK